MGINEYTVSGHIMLPYNKKIERIFYRKSKVTNTEMYYDDELISRRTTIPKDFIKKYLLPIGYVTKTNITTELRNRIKINDIPIGITRIKKGRKTVELLITVHAEDMRSVIASCDQLVQYVEDKTGDKVTTDAKLWTKQEMC